MDKRRLQSAEPKQKTGLIVVFTGEGKGKTTAALGIALRAAGHNMKVCIIQFMKGTMYSGEIDGLKRFAPDIELHIAGKGFYKKTGDPKTHAAHRQKAQNALVLAKEKMASGHFDILILDEINNALKLKLVDLAQVIEMIDVKPPLMHLVLTGRDVHPAVVRRANIVTDMQEIKHPYRQGIEPQKGIDY